MLDPREEVSAGQEGSRMVVIRAAWEGYQHYSSAWYMTIIIGLGGIFIYNHSTHGRTVA